MYRLLTIPFACTLLVACNSELNPRLFLDNGAELEDGATDVPVGTSFFVVSFDEPMGNDDIIALLDTPMGGTELVVTQGGSDAELELSLYEPFDYNTAYTLEVGSNVGVQPEWVLNRDFTTEAGPEADDVSVVIDNAPPSELAIGESVLLSALAFGNSGEITDAAIEWSTANANIATISSGGLLTGVSTGTTTVTAAFADATDDASVTVVDPCEPQIDLTFSGTPITQNVEAQAGDCLSDGGTYASNIRLVVPEQTSFLLEASQTGGESLCDIRFFDEDGTQVVDAFNGFPHPRVNLDAGTYRVEFASQDAGLPSSATLRIANMCDAPRGTGMSTFGSPTHEFSIDENDCFDPESGLYRYYVSYTTNANDLPGTTTLTITLDSQVPTLRLRTTADGNFVSDGTSTNSTGTTWTYNYSGSYGIDAWIYVSQPVSGSVRVTR